MRSERGSASVVVAALTAIVVVCTTGAADVGKALTAKGRAQSAADAAALAATQELALPSGRSPADVAAEYVGHNGAELIACRCEPGTTEAIVEVIAPVGSLLLVPGDRTGGSRARALVDIPGAPA